MNEKLKADRPLHEANCKCPLITDKRREISDCIPCVMVLLLHSGSQALISKVLSPCYTDIKKWMRVVTQFWKLITNFKNVLYSLEGQHLPVSQSQDVAKYGHATAGDPRGKWGRSPQRKWRQIGMARMRLYKPAGGQLVLAEKSPAFLKVVKWHNFHCYAIHGF